MAVQPLPKNFQGFSILKKTAGQSTPAVGTEYKLPYYEVTPVNPNNIAYFAMVNAAGALSGKVAGKKTPSVHLSFPLKASWFTGASSAGINMLSDFLGLAASFLDTGLNSSEYGIQVNDGAVSRVYDGMKCAQMSLRFVAGGPIVMETSWIGIYGDSEKGTPTTFSSYSTDGGAVLDSTNVDFNATATDVQRFDLTMIRAQGYQSTADGTLYMASVESGIVGYMFNIVQGAGAGVTVPSTSCTIKISNGGGAGTGIQFALTLSKDEVVKPVGTGLGVQTNRWTGFSSGVIPVVLSAF